jgi:hypothetical protein
MTRMGNGRWIELRINDKTFKKTIYELNSRNYTIIFTIKVNSILINVLNFLYWVENTQQNITRKFYEIPNELK